jgi:hypothetical protein
MLREVRRAINDFRDGRYEGFIQARNRLLLTGMATSGFTYLLLGLAVVIHVPTAVIASAVTFYLVGALVGLFNRLSADTEADSATEDYGLSAVRLLYTPLFCGLAAVGGIFIVAMLPYLSPGSGPPAGGSVNFRKVFDVTQNPSGLLVAAVFGLTPNLLITRLKQQTDRYKSDLKRTESTSGDA